VLGSNGFEHHGDDRRALSDGSEIDAAMYRRLTLS
jgi:hypothetical protein